MVLKRVGSGDSGELSVGDDGSSSGTAASGFVEIGQSSRVAMRQVGEAEGSDETHERQLAAR